jgi:hypothetical protein
MTDRLLADSITDALEEIRKPSEHLLATSMRAVRSTPINQRRSPALVPIAALVVVATVLALIGVVTLSRALPQVQEAPSGSCSVPVLSDFGSGLLHYPSATFSWSGLPAAQATAYDEANHRWYATVPEGISPDGRLVALHDNVKGHNATMTLETASGQVLYTRDSVNRILGWTNDGRLVFSTIDTDRLATVSSSGTGFAYIDPVGYAGDTWRFAMGTSVWGVTPQSFDDPQHRIFVVKLDLNTGAVSRWFALVPGSFNDSGGGIVLGLTADGYPVLPGSLSDASPGIVVVKQPNVATPIHVQSATDTITSNFWPFHAFGDAKGIWLTTYDGELYRSLKDGPFKLVSPANGMHVFAFAGGCA